MYYITYGQNKLENKILNENALSEQEVIDAQNLWADQVVQIGYLYTSNLDYKKKAYDFVKNFYAYEISNVLFKPTLASKNQFRLKLDDALSYFIGGSIKEDKGFALRPWKKITFGDRNFILKDNIALVMGNYYFQSIDEDEEIKVVYTFGYIRNSNGKPVINLHHSSLPYLSN